MQKDFEQQANKNEGHKNMSKISSLSVLFKWNKVKTLSAKTLPRSRCKHACCLHNEYIYLIGGKDGNVSLKDFCRFHIGTNRWEELSYRGEKIPYFEGHSLVPHKRLLLVFGGVLNYDHTESALWIINPDLQYIRKHVPDLGSPQPSARQYHTAIVYNNVMYVYGGFLDLQGSSSEIWAYHIDDEEWELISPNQRPDYTAGKRHGHTAVLYGRDMWVFGGMSSLQAKSDFWKFNFHSLKWDRIKTKFGPPCLSGHTATVVKDYMVVTGGESNGVLSSDIWVFGFCTLKWTHYQPTNQYPSPCKWHTVIPITTRYRKGDNSVRTKSLPYLQKKGQKNMVNRPRSSPVYSSARLARKSPDHCENVKNNRPVMLDLNMTSEIDQNKCVSQPIEMKSFNSERSEDRRSPFRGNGYPDKSPKQKEEKSPLLCDRQMSRDSVISNGSGLGTDNPCLELDSSCEGLDKFTSCKNKDSDLVSYEMMDFNKNSEQRRSPNEQYVTRFVKNKKQNFHTSYIPGQVNISPTNNGKYLIKNNINQNNKNDLIVEDLEFCDNYFSNHFHLSARHANRGFPRHDSKHSSNQDLKLKHSCDSEFSETHFNRDRNVHRENSLEEKSLSMSDISQTNLIQNEPVTIKSTSMHLPQITPKRRCSLNCWLEEIEDTNETLSPIDVDGKLSTSSKFVKQLNQEEVKENENKQIDDGGLKETVVENGPPYLLMFGGHEERKGHNISVESITVWQCDVLVRHSDISHGEFFKSSLVI